MKKITSLLLVCSLVFTANFSFISVAFAEEEAIVVPVEEQPVEAVEPVITEVEPLIENTEPETTEEAEEILPTEEEPESEETPPGMAAATQTPVEEGPTLPFTPARQGMQPSGVKNFGFTDEGIINQSFVNLFSGTANIQLPLRVPEGRNGMTPDLTLSYNSQLVESNGPFGFGWEMELGQIKRLNKLGISDMYTDPVYHVSLGGLQGELTPIASRAPSDTIEYRMRREENFVKFSFNPSLQTWEITTKEGIKYKLGTSDQSRFKNEDDGKVFSWHLEQVQDLNGNVINYEYERIDNTLYPKKITYGAKDSTTPPFEIRFQTSDRPDVRTDFTKGFLTEYDQRVSAVEVYFNNEKKLSYDLTYTNYQHKDRSNLKSLKISGKNPQDGQEISQTLSFSYYEPEEGYTGEELQYKHKFLRSMKFHQGGEMIYNYTSSKTFFDNTGALSNKTPFPQYVVSSVTQKDSYSPDIVTNYSYENGYYFFDSPVEREVAGFGRVTESDAVGQKTKYYFHQNDWSLIGRMHRTELYDARGKMLQKNISTWTKKSLGANRNFIYAASQVSTTLDGETKSTASATTYNLTNGNVIEQIAYGEVSAADDGTFTDTLKDKTRTVITYASNSEKYLLSFPESQKFYDFDNKLLRETHYLYDNLEANKVEKGNTTSQINYLLETAKTLTTTYQYNILGQITKVTDPRGNSTEITFDALSLYPAKIKNQLGHTSSFEYEYISGQVQKTVDPNAATSQTIFDGLGRVTEQKVSSFENAQTLTTIAKTTYSDTSAPNYTESEVFFDSGISGKQRVYVDGFGRVIQERKQSETSGKFAVVDHVYNKLGQKEKDSLPYFSTGLNYTNPTSASALYTSYTYDTLGRVKSAKNAIGTTSNTYKGWTVTTKDANGKTKDFISDASQRLITVNEYDSGKKYITSYTYDPTGALLRITDSKGNLRNFSYDSLGRLKKQEDLHAPADTTFAIWQYEYDDTNNLTLLTRADGSTVTYSYDGLNRMLTEDSSTQADVEVLYSYDTALKGIGKPAGVKNKSILNSFEYNNRGLPAKDTKVIDGITYTTNYIYDLQGKVKEQTLPDGSSIKNTYNIAGAVEKLQKKEAAEATFTDLIKNYDYSPLGQVTKIEYANGAITTNTYDANTLYRLKNKSTTVNGKKLQDITYTIDQVGNITKVVDLSAGHSMEVKTLPKGDINLDGPINAMDTTCEASVLIWYASGKMTGPSPVCFKNQNYLAADLDCNTKLTSVDLQIVNLLANGTPLSTAIDTDQDNIHNGCEPQSPIIKNETYTTAKTATYTYDDLHRLTSVNVINAPTTSGGNYTQTFKYDSVGNMISNSTIGAMTYGETAASPFANPHALTATSTGKKFTYDKNGNMTSDGAKTMTWSYRDELLTTNMTGTPNTTTFAYDATGQRVKKNNDKYISDIYEVDSTGKVSRHIGEITLETKNGKVDTYTNIKDHLSSSSFMLDATGTPVQVLDYYPFGATRLNKQLSSFDENRKYTGHELDEETGLYYANARYLDPVLARFISLDPWSGDLKDPQSLNKYAYARNNPMKYTDPTGKFSEKSIKSWTKFFERQTEILNKAGDKLTFGNYSSSIAIAQAAGDRIHEEGLNWDTASNAAVAVVKGTYKMGSGALAKGVEIGWRTNSAKRILLGIAQSLSEPPLPEDVNWSPGPPNNPVQNAMKHFNDHKQDFNASTPQEYVETAQDFLSNPPEGTLTHIEEKGDKLYYHKESNTFGVTTPSGVPKTIYKPDLVRNGSQEKFWNAKLQQ